MAAGFSIGPAIKVQRRPKNLLDVTTIVSIYPEPIKDYKPTVTPANHTVPAAPVDGFSLLVVGGASWFKEMDEGQPFLEIPITSMQVAEAIIRDNCNGLIGYVPESSAPGLFIIPGRYDEKTILNAAWPDEIDESTGKVIKKGATFNELLFKAKIRQKAWMSELVRLADIMWARTNGNPLSISKDARLAAEILGLTNKPWMGDILTLSKSNCPACGFLVDTVYPICPNCKAVVNEVKAKELNLKFAS